MAKPIDSPRKSDLSGFSSQTDWLGQEARRSKSDLSSYIFSTSAKLLEKPKLVIRQVRPVGQ